jgi:hypothetical protein
MMQRGAYSAGLALSLVEMLHYTHRFDDSVEMYVESYYNKISNKQENRKSNRKPMRRL